MSDARAVAQHELEDSQGRLPRASIYELVEEAAYLLLENNSPDLLAYVTELVRQGLSPEEIVDRFEAETRLPRWRVAYLGCAGAYILKHDVPVIG
jgi:hypothetical protein